MDTRQIPPSKLVPRYKTIQPRKLFLNTNTHTHTHMRFSLPALTGLAGLFAFATLATAAGIPEVCCISTPASASDPCSSGAAKRSLPRAAAGCSCFAPDLASCFVTCCPAS
ncbi:hypothetical protein MVEN_01422300 [Mycena venus]|uniref:Uncharacterized protein n=1 Tax=Mycena venus TaxID=2733690 RepID=A0A8H6XZA1_9AGAR|nr:hypothetical protein MVEN_01422300 [Mycena venus]